ncbi:hypothetical protein CBS101457_000194 [Exobasidium rhododendri]|nr:hypothetical protein CBS101457_000194 [Exobasidium rhododendri]
MPYAGSNSYFGGNHHRNMDPTAHGYNSGLQSYGDPSYFGQGSSSSYPTYSTDGYNSQGGHDWNYPNSHDEPERPFGQPDIAPLLDDAHGLYGTDYNSRSEFTSDPYYMSGVGYNGGASSDVAFGDPQLPSLLDARYDIDVTPVGNQDHFSSQHHQPLLHSASAEAHHPEQRVSTSASQGAASPSSLTPIPSPCAEYTFQFDRDFPIPQSSRSVYSLLPKEHRLILTERVAQVRPFKTKVIQYHLDQHLNTEFALMLLSDDQKENDEAALIVLPDSLRKKKNGSLPIHWMDGLKNWQRREAIRRLAEVTLQPADKLREHLLHYDKRPIVAQKILDATSQEEIWRIAEKWNLILPPIDPTNKHQPKVWQKGMSNMQRAALRQALARYCSMDIDAFIQMLGKSWTPPGYGLTMLRVAALPDPAGFVEIIKAVMRQDRSTPLPFTGHS